MALLSALEQRGFRLYANIGQNLDVSMLVLLDFTIALMRNRQGDDIGYSIADVWYCCRPVDWEANLKVYSDYDNAAPEVPSKDTWWIMIIRFTGE